MSEELPNPAHVDVEAVEEHRSPVQTLKHSKDEANVRTAGSTTRLRLCVAGPGLYGGPPIGNSSFRVSVQGSLGDTTSHPLFSRKLFEVNKLQYIRAIRGHLEAASPW